MCAEITRATTNDSPASCEQDASATRCDRLGRSGRFRAHLEGDAAALRPARAAIAGSKAKDEGGRAIADKARGSASRHAPGHGPRAAQPASGSAAAASRKEGTGRAVAGGSGPGGSEPLGLPHDRGEFGADWRGGWRSRCRTHGDESMAVVEAPFRPPPTILSPPMPGALGSTHAASPGSHLERAQTAALVTRLVTSLRVGKVGHDGHQVRLGLRMPTGDLCVQLDYAGGRLCAVIRGDAHQRDIAERLAGRVREALARNGAAEAEVSVDLD